MLVKGALVTIIYHYLLITKITQFNETEFPPQVSMYYKSRVSQWNKTFIAAVDYFRIVVRASQKRYINGHSPFRCCAEANYFVNKLCWKENFTLWPFSTIS